MGILLGVLILAAMAWLRPFVQHSELSSAIKSTLLCMGISALHLILQGIAELLPSIKGISETFKLLTFYTVWPFLVSIWLAEAGFRTRWSMGTWGRIFIGWMAMFELIRRMESLEPYWQVLSIFLPLALAAALLRCYQSGQKDPMLFALPFMLVALYQHPNALFGALFEAGFTLYFVQRFVIPLAKLRIIQGKTSHEKSTL